MKVLLPKAEFAKALERVQAAVPTRTPLTALKNIAIDTAGPFGAKVRASTGSLTIQAHTSPIEVVREGAIALPAEILCPLVPSLAGEVITIDADMERLIATISCRKQEYAIHGIKADAIPPMPVPAGDDILSFQVKASALNGAINDVLFSASRDETSPTLASVYVDAVEDGINFVGFNRHRLSVSNLSVEYTATGETRNSILPREHAEKIAKALPGGERPVTVSFTPHLIGAVCEGLEMVSSLVEGEYPDYAAFCRMTEENVAATTKVNRRDLLEAIGRLLLVSGATGDSLNLRKVRLVAKGDGLEVSRNAAEVGNAHESIPAESDGEWSAAYSGIYLRDALGSLEGDDLSLGYVKIPTNQMQRPLLIESGHRLLCVTSMGNVEE